MSTASTLTSLKDLQDENGEFENIFVTAVDNVKDDGYPDHIYTMNKNVPFDSDSDDNESNRDNVNSNNNADAVEKAKRFVGTGMFE